MYRVIKQLRRIRLRPLKRYLRRRDHASRTLREVLLDPSEKAFERGRVLIRSTLASEMFAEPLTEVAADQLAPPSWLRDMLPRPSAYRALK